MSLMNHLHTDLSRTVLPSFIFGFYCRARVYPHYHIRSTCPVVKRVQSNNRIVLCQIKLIAITIIEFNIYSNFNGFIWSVEAPTVSVSNLSQRLQFLTVWWKNQNFIAINHALDRMHIRIFTHAWRFSYHKQQQIYRLLNLGINSVLLAQGLKYYNIWSRTTESYWCTLLVFKRAWAQQEISTDAIDGMNSSTFTLEGQILNSFYIFRSGNHYHSCTYHRL